MTTHPRRIPLTVWLTTWERMGDDRAGAGERIAFIDAPQWAAPRVAHRVEMLYVSTLPIAQQFEYLRTINGVLAQMSRRVQYYRHPLRYAKWCRANGGEYIKAGDEPFLYARLVTNLHSEGDATGREHVVWDELVTPSDEDHCFDC